MTTTLTLQLPTEIEDLLRQRAEQMGIEVADYIALLVLAQPSDDTPPSQAPLLSDLLQGLVGVIDSSREPRPERAPSAFGEIIAEKFRKQGLRC